MTKEQYEEFLAYHDNLYYNNDNPEIDDYEYDKIKNEYITRYGEYNYVPGDVKTDLKKYNHKYNVISLAKVQISDTDNLIANIKRLWPIVIQPKMDGLTIVTYTDHHVTRGNGHIGEIVDDTVKYCAGIGSHDNIDVRSEAILLHSEFENINKEREKRGLEKFKSYRNAAAGLIRSSKNPMNIPGLKLFAYNILNSNATANEQIELLKANGWNTVDSYIPESIDDALNYIRTFDRNKLDYDIDGLVIKHNGDKDFGEVEHHPLNAIAVKFEAEGAWTKIKDIEWTVGRTGNITPIAILEPVDIMNSIISKATLHNYNVLCAKKLNMLGYIDKYTSGTEVYVIKSNDVIPKIIDVRFNKNCKYSKIIHKPNKCPSCDSKLVNDTCINPYCKSKLVNNLNHLAERDAFNITCLGKETVNKIYTNLNITYPWDIFNLTTNDFLTLDGFAEKSATKLYNEIQKSRTISLDRFIYGIGIPLVGVKVAKDVANEYGSLQELLSDINFDRLKNINGIGDAIINSLINNRDIFYKYTMLNIQDVEVKKKNTKAKKFVITGSFEIPRNQIKDLIESKGHSVVSSVSKKTDYVVLGEDAGSKADKAKELNINVITKIEDLKEILSELS